MKFRALCEDSKRMYEPDGILKDGRPFLKGAGKGQVTVYDSPVMQSTGLHDKNGVEIFEGDKFAEFNAVVKFEKGAFWVIHDYHNERRPTLLHVWLDKRELARTGTEIIGNIHQPDQR